MLETNTARATQLKDMLADFDHFGKSSQEAFEVASTLYIYISGSPGMVHRFYKDSDNMLSPVVPFNRDTWQSSEDGLKKISYVNEHDRRVKTKWTKFIRKFNDIY